MTESTLFTPADAATAHEVRQWLAHESRLLDEGRFDDWFLLLDDDIDYDIPMRVATDRREDETAAPTSRIKDAKEQLRVRIERLRTGIAYAEMPPSRTLRVVGEVEVSAPGPDAPEVVEACSAMLLYRQRAIDAHFDLVPARRYDRFRRTPDGLRLLARRVILTETIVATPNLGVFL